MHENSAFTANILCYWVNILAKRIQQMLILDTSTAWPNEIWTIHFLEKWARFHWRSLQQWMIPKECILLLSDFFNLLGFATGIKDLKRNILNVKLKLLTITLVFGKILTNQRPWFILIDQSEVRIVSKFFLCKNWESARIECKFLAAALPRVKTTPSMELSQPPWPSYKYT